MQQPPGSYDVCPVCFWEDDVVALRWPDRGGTANVPSLIEAQRTYAAVGAIEERFADKVRPPTDDEPLDDGWRPCDPAENSPQTSHWPADPTTLYYWRR
jgi:hypothetical protein